MTDKLTLKIERLFSRYLAAFEAYDLESVCACYHLPCTLNTPDKIILLTDTEQCRQEFSDIFAQLKQANTRKIMAQKASFMQISENLLLACVNWDFIDDNNQVFADFCAFYHISMISNDSAEETNQELKIMNVVSHELSNAISLPHSFSVKASINNI
ncbi:MAG: hypothetical protein OQK09_00545 [Colwellia sp.]|nr:hypothetical protein [Colwellia sp.]MCW9079976.1 hypothetical protein [Colwellia sp.]